MSIILDALRKSERERRLGQIPTLDGGAPAPASPRRAAAWAVLAIAIAGLLAGGAYWWTMPPQRPDAAATAPPIADVPMPQAPASAAPRVSASQDGDAGSPKATAGELSAAAPANLPAMNLNALSWSEDPKRRFAMINQAIVREGQQLANGAVLREITRDSAVLEIRGQRFTLRP